MNIKKVGFLSGTVLVALLLVVLIIAYVFNIRGESDKNSFHQDDLYTVSKRNITSVVSINGNVRYSAIEKLSFPVGGEIETIFVREGQIIAEGNQNVKDLYKKFNLELPDIESSTIGGYIMDLAKKIPLYGEIINDKYFNYKVISHSRKQVLRVEISQIN